MACVGDLTRKNFTDYIPEDQTCCDRQLKMKIKTFWPFAFHITITEGTHGNFYFNGFISFEILDCTRCYSEYCKKHRLCCMASSMACLKMLSTFEKIRFNTFCEHVYKWWSPWKSSCIPTVVFSLFHIPTPTHVVKQSSFDKKKTPNIFYRLKSIVLSIPSERR